MPLDRRHFLQLTAAGMVASLTSSACAHESDEAVRALPELADMLGPERVREIGAHYRASVPKENTEAALRAAISDSESEQSPLAWIRRRSMEQMVRDDFEAGRTVVVDGWVLSATEARHCALFSLASA